MSISAESYTHVSAKLRAAQATGRIAQMRRWLANTLIDVPTFYRPLIRDALAGWAVKDVFAILDGCLVNHEALQFFRLSLSHCFRARPLTWRDEKGPGLLTVEKCAGLSKFLGFERGLLRIYSWTSGLEPPQRSAGDTAARSCESRAALRPV